jgi:RHS repeat-associated protein
MSVLENEIRAKGCFPREVTGRSYLARLGPQPDEERDASGKTVKRYFSHGFQSVTAGGATNYYYTKDHLGSIREVVDGSGSVKSRYDYDPYGRRTLVSGTDLADFGFTGFLYHKSTGLNLTLFRAYDSDLGRWLSRDPIAERGGLNLYGYVGNNPINNTDLIGLIIDIELGDRVIYGLAKAYVSIDPVTKANFDKLENSPIHYKLVTNNDHDDTFDTDTNEIYWDPNSALRTTNGCIQSPAIGLAHEVDHAVNGSTFLVNISDPNYDFWEERRVITGSETRLAKLLGEPTRTNHDGKPLRVNGPLSRTPVRP